MMKFKKVGKKISLIEKLIYTFTLMCLVATPVLVLSISSLRISLDKQTSDVQTQISVQEQVNQATGIKISEKSTYDEIYGTASKDGLTQQGDNVRSVNE